MCVRWERVTRKRQLAVPSSPPPLTFATTVALASEGDTALAMSMGVDTPAVPGWVSPSGKVMAIGTAAARAASS